MKTAPKRKTKSPATFEEEYRSALGEYARDGAIFPNRAKADLVVQDDAEEGIVDVDLAVVLDEAQFAEFVHEKIDAGPRCSNHLRQHFLGNLRKHLLRLVLRAIAREQQQSARQPFLAGVEELIDQVLFDADVSTQHISDEAVGELVFLGELGDHRGFLSDKHVGSGTH